MRKIIFDVSLLILIFSAAALDGPGYIQYISAAISGIVIFLFAYANRWKA